MLALVNRFILPAAESLLPPVWQDDRATRLLLAICWQESRAAHRVQIGGPARGLWQFERGGGWLGVIQHPLTASHARGVLDSLLYSSRDFECLADNDVLAAAFARMLLRTHPKALPSAEAGGWEQYLQVWRPGKPHVKTWPEAWARAGQVMETT
jgi:hypothetical protein